MHKWKGNVEVNLKYGNGRYLVDSSGLGYELVVYPCEQVAKLVLLSNADNSLTT